MSSNVSVMHGRKLFVKGLQKGRYTQRLTARVSRLWKTYNVKKPVSGDSRGELMSLEFVTIDERDDAIVCLIRSRFIPDFEGLISEGSVYTIRNFNVQPEKPKYRVLQDSELFIAFDGSTSVEEVIVNVPRILMHKFSITPYNLLMATSANRKNLCDIIGYVSLVSDVAARVSNFRPIKLQTVELHDLSGRVVKLTLWGEDAIRAFGLNSGREERVCIVTSTIVSLEENVGYVAIATSSATKFYSSDDLEEIREFKLSLPAGIISTELKRTVLYSPLIKKNDYLSKKKSTEQIQAILDDGGAFDGMLYLYGRIKEIREEGGWKYNACSLSSCRKKLVLQGGYYYCTKCLKIDNSPSIRYRVEIVVEDEKGAIDCVLFDREVVRLVTMQAMQLAQLSSELDDAMPPKLRTMLGKSLIFQLRPNVYMGGSSRENFTVTRIVNEADIVADDVPVHEAITDGTEIMNGTTGGMIELGPSAQLTLEKRKRRGSGKSVVSSDEEADLGNANAAGIPGENTKKPRRRLTLADNEEKE